MELEKFLTQPNQPVARKIFWFSLSMAFATIYGGLALQESFSNKYIIPEDARPHLFWMERFIDAQLFPHDLIADYFQSISPPGFSLLYQLFASIGIEPILLNKFLPIILGLVSTAYCFGIALEILPIPAAGFAASLLLNQGMWLDTTLASGIAKAFVYPLFLAFLYYLLRRSYLGVGISIGILGLFYAPLMLVSSGILLLRIFILKNRSLRLSEDKRDYFLCFIGLGVTFLVSLLYLTQSSEYGPTIAASEARKLPEFLPGGRASFFDDKHPWKFWLQGNRSGIRLSINPALVSLGFLLPILFQFPSRFSLLKYISKDISILVQITLSSLALFFLSHVFLFKLFLPSRYTIHSLRIVIALAAGLVLILIVDGFFKTFKSLIFLPIIVTVILGFFLLFYPNLFWRHFPRTGSIIGSQPELYDFFLKQPKDIIIASLAQEASNIPTFSYRSVLVASEQALPYHVGYYKQIRQRANDLIEAQYSPDIKLVKDFITKYNISFFLIEKNAFQTEYLEKNFWFKQWKPVAEKVKTQLNQGNVPVIEKIVPACTSFENQEFIVISGKCIASINEE